MSANDINRQSTSSSSQRREAARRDAAREHGQIIAFSNCTLRRERAVPTVVLRNELRRTARILADGTPVELEFNIVNRVYPEGTTA
jgi:hypothetical protein